VSARDEVLARIRTALGDGPPVLAPVARDYRTADDLPPGDPGLLDLLTDRLVDYKATVMRCGPDDVATTVATAVPPGAVLVAPGLPQSWRSAGATEDDGRPAVELADYAAAVTGVAVAVAETGTLFLDGSATSGRRALSLLPDCLVCVVTADQVVGGVPTGLTRVDPVAPLTMISGPSATSDIELERVEGVHGPRTLIVVLVTPTERPTTSTDANSVRRGR
jgi:L-lactate dehydrogenase complex protein LldG